MGTERFLVAVGNYDEAVDSAGNLIDNNVSAYVQLLANMWHMVHRQIWPNCTFVCV